MKLALEEKRFFIIAVAVLAIALAYTTIVQPPVPKVTPTPYPTVTPKPLPTSVFVTPTPTTEPTLNPTITPAASETPSPTASASAAPTVSPFVEVDLSIQEFYFSQRTIFLNEGDKVVLKVSNYDYQRDFSIPDLNYSASLPVNSTATFNFTAKPGNYWFAVMNQYEAHPQLTGRILVGGVIG